MDRKSRLKNISSLLLSKEENEVIFKLLGTGCQTLSTTVVELRFKKTPRHRHWKVVCKGVVCLVRDVTKRSHFIRIYDLDNWEQVWEQELFHTVVYRTPKRYLHVIEAQEVWGLCFDDKSEAKHFGNAVNDILMKQISRFEYFFGWNQMTGFDVQRVDKRMIAFLESAGISREELKDDMTRDFIFDFIEKNGGCERAISEGTETLLTIPTPFQSPHPSYNPWFHKKKKKKVSPKSRGMALSPPQQPIQWSTRTTRSVPSGNRIPSPSRSHFDEMPPSLPGAGIPPPPPLPPPPKITSASFQTLTSDQIKDQKLKKVITNANTKHTDSDVPSLAQILGAKSTLRSGRGVNIIDEEQADDRLIRPSVHQNHPSLSDNEGTDFYPSVNTVQSTPRLLLPSPPPIWTGTGIPPPPPLPPPPKTTSFSFQALTSDQIKDPKLKKMNTNVHKKADVPSLAQILGAKSALKSSKARNTKFEAQVDNRDFMMKKMELRRHLTPGVEDKANPWRGWESSQNRYRKPVLTEDYKRTEGWDQIISGVKKGRQGLRPAMDRQLKPIPTPETTLLDILPQKRQHFRKNRDKNRVYEKLDDNENQKKN